VGGATIARYDVLLSKVDSPFHLVHLAAKRAREINGYYAHLGEGLTQYVPPLLTHESNKALSIALEEIAEGKVIAVEPSDEPNADPLAFIEHEGDAEPASGPGVDLFAVPDVPDAVDADVVTEPDASA
jgi:DNA-directed RNA polymerase subunit omega